MAEQKIRSYEVSIWTLQDRFISVLKWSELDCKGQIQSPEVTLNDDGTESFTFSIPKFYYSGATKIANPMWLHLENQPLEANMHKLKVIFNKNTEVEKVLEFLVTEVVQEHTSDNVMLNITTEGLAFNELGKIGYRLALSEQNYINALDKWTENGMVAANMPLNNIQFWNDLIFKDSNNQWRTNWTYEVQMDWSAFSTNTNGAYKQSNVVYEDEYVTSWNVTASDTLTPRGVQATQEKCRIITESESNIYNLTQTIAEQFGVFCRYEYEHDQNYQITGRKVIYYNNYLYDIAGHVDLTYPYSSASIKRTVDNADIITKMFVNSVDYNDDYVTIMDIDANKSGEDYLLNFDYLHDIQAISDDQYNEISKYEVTLHKINTNLKELQERIRIVENQLNEENAKVTTLENAVKLDQERYTEAGQQRAAISDGTGFTPLEGVGCTVLYETGRGFYINIRWEGLQENTLKLYQNCDFSESENQFSGLISSYQFDRDEFQNITRIKNITAPTKLHESDKIWIKGYYNPTLAWDKVQKVWEIRLSRDQIALAKAKANVEKFEYYLNGDPNDINLVSESCPNLYHQETVLLARKQQAINSFERMMGPALREGYWNPENYHDYGDLYCDTITITSNSAQTLSGNSGFLEFKWDSAKYYDNEEPLIYTANTAGDMEQHLVIDLSSDIETYSSHLSDLCFVYCTPSSVSTIKEIESKTEGSIEDAEEWKESLKATMYNVFRVGADCELGWVSTRGRPATRKPVLIVTGAKTLDNNTINFIRTGKYTVSTISVDDEAVVTTTRTLNKNEDAEYLAFIGLIEYDSDGMVIPNSWTNRRIVSNSNLFIGQRAVSGTPTPQEYQYVREYPRFYFNSLKLKQDEVKVVANQNLLQNYEDYSIVVDDRSTGLTPTGIGYYLTLKPEILLKAPYTATTECTIAYSLSNLDVAIYLDSLKVMNENSKPKVSYEIELSLLNPELIHTAYNRLNQIVHINDIDLQLEYVSGYISTVTMSLDKPWEDTVEIKNYETKFEDLFSTIVAQTQAMQQSGGILSALAGGTLSLKAGSVENTLSLNHDIISAYLDSYFDSSQVVLDKLTALFTEAGEILASAGTTINRTSSLAIENINILQGFASQIARELAPKVVYGSVQPVYFKTGDIWIQTDQNGKEIGRYVATADSTESKDGYGYTRTYDGTLAAIRGSNLQIDTVNGVVDVQAENEINLKSGGNVYIAANDRVDIVGNKQVNIGGTTVNIASSSDYTTGGINLVSSAISFSKTQDPQEDIQRAIQSTDTGISKVLISPTKIEMGSADILMRGNNKITMVTSRSNDLSSTSAIEISPDSGIWIGSGKSIRLFSGGGRYSTSEDAILGLDVSGASVELNDQHLILGYSSIQANTSTAVEMNQDHLMIAAGGNIGSEWQKSKSYAVGDIVTHENKYYKCTTAHTSGTTWDSSKWTNHTYSITGTSSGLVGALFTKNSIGFATGSGNSINAILMNNNGITIGSGSIDVTQSKTQLRASKGSYVRIASDGIDIGSLANLYINSNNFKLQTDTYANGAWKTELGNTIFAIGKNLNGLQIGADTDPSTITNSNSSEVNLLLNYKGLYINGIVNASAFKASATNGYFLAKGNSLGFYNNSNDAIITIDDNAHIVVSKELDITANNFYLHTDQNSKTTFGIGTGVRTYSAISPWVIDKNCSGIQYIDDTLYVKGSIYTFSGKIGGWDINQDSIQHNKMYLIGDGANAGIQLIGVTSTAPLTVNKDNKDYVAYEASGSEATYYVYGNKGNQFTVTAENRGDIIEYLPEVVSVRPIYTYSRTLKAKLDDNTTVLYTYVETYIVDEKGNYLLYNNNPIMYNSSNSPTAEWYTQLQAAYPSDITKYVVYTYSNEPTLKASIIENGKTLTKVSDSDVTFSVRASDGYMKVNNGKLGNFDLTAKGLERGLLSHSTITKCTIDGYKSSQYGECFCNVEVNTKKGIITLKKINGEKVKINLAKMEALQKKIVETATNYTESGTSSDGSPIYTESSSCNSCSTACKSGCGTSCSNDCTGECDTTNTADCKSSCTGGCNSTCVNICRNDCVTGCTGGCQATCSGGCYTTCSGAAKSTSCTTCGTTCGTTCTQTCANTCASNCTNTVSSHS